MVDIEHTRFDDGIVIHGDCLTSEVRDFVEDSVGEIHLIVTDPPYNINIAKWDRVEDLDDVLFEFLNIYSHLLLPNSAAYVFGGIGKPGNRPFFKFLSEVEDKTQFQLSNLITWSKKRAYGVQHNYLFTREEIAYLVLGSDIKKPRVFNVPYLDQLRGYEGYNKKYPAKSPYKRRTSVWTDVTEILRGKVHETEKPVKLINIMIEASSNPGETVLDQFAGSGSTAVSARGLGRRFVLIEKDEKYYKQIVDQLSKP